MYLASKIYYIFIAVIRKSAYFRANKCWHFELFRSFAPAVLIMFRLMCATVVTHILSLIRSLGLCLPLGEN